MKSFVAVSSLFFFVYACNFAIGQQLTREPENSTAVPLATDPRGLAFGVGLSSRDADHGTVAMNDERDIVVAFHTSRTAEDLPDPNTVLWAGKMKQVEIAYFDYQVISGVETWVHLDTKIIGSVEASSVSGTTQVLVKCERPDVIAVGNKFFVVWTRRYESQISGQANEPAVMECAWVEESGLTSDPILVHGQISNGRGFELDKHIPSTNPFEVLECGGVPDAVQLIDPLEPNKLEVAVVYPRQTLFGTGPNSSREFELNIVTCRFEPSSGQITKISDYPPIELTVPFNGLASPGGNTAGLILPDVAPSPDKNAFWLIYERQKMKPTTLFGNRPDGRIRLEYFQHDPNVGPPSGTWESIASKTFKGSMDEWSWKRRPMISSYTKDGTDVIASIAYFTTTSMDDAEDTSVNVVYEDWALESGGLVSPPTYSGTTPPIFSLWPNSSQAWDDRPLPLIGRSSPPIRRCFATRAASPSGAASPPSNLVVFDPIYPATFTTLDEDDQTISGIRRPAASYHFHSGATDPDYFAVTWEKVAAGQVKRIHMLVQ